MFTSIHYVCKVFAASNYPLDDYSLDNDLSRMKLTPDDFSYKISQRTTEYKRPEKAERRRTQKLQKPREKIVVLETDAGEKFEVDLNASSSFLLDQMMKISKTLTAIKYTHFDLEKIKSYINADPLEKLYLPKATMDEMREKLNKVPHQYVGENKQFTYKQLLKNKQTFVEAYTHEVFIDTKLGKLFQQVEHVQRQIRNREQFAVEFFEDLENPKIKQYVSYFIG